MTERDPVRYSLEELASLAGVTARTIRYYVTEGLLPPPLGRGPGRHYGDEHLTGLRRVQYYRGLGADLASIKRLFAGRATPDAQQPDARQVGPIDALVPGAVWIRGGKTALPSAQAAKGMLGAETGDPTRPPPAISLWTKVEIMPGVELQVHRDLALPGEAALQHLADQCRVLFAAPEPEDPKGLDRHGTD